MLLYASPSGLAAWAAPANTVNSRDRPDKAHALKFIIALPNRKWHRPSVRDQLWLLGPELLASGCLAAFKLVRSSVAEAGRESNDRVSPQQLSLLHHRESDYSSALERRFFVMRHTRPAHPIRESLNRSLPRAVAKSASRANIRRRARVAIDHRQRRDEPHRSRRLATTAAIHAAAAIFCGGSCHCNERRTLLFARGRVRIVFDSWRKRVNCGDGRTRTSSPASPARRSLDAEISPAIPATP